MKTVNKVLDTDGVQEIIYTCPANCRSHVSMLHIVNAGGNTDLDVTFYRAAATQTALNTDAIAHVLGGKNMVLGDYITFVGAEMIMEPGDTIRATADNATPHIDIMATVEEFFTVPG